ncbi:MAG TPA: hypothetical protein VJG49_02805 [Candidatus Nanoarchaeia archaeon]|nr:hypothetical protein [Candidatus Nanoarchaeia archaeon]
MSTDLYKFVAELTPEELVYLLYSRKAYPHHKILFTLSQHLD